MKLFFKKLGLLIFFSLATLVGTEVLLRVLNPTALKYYRDVKLLHAYHPEYGVTLQAGESRYVRHHAGLWEGRFTTNSLGLRGLREPELASPKILCLGDSMVMGFGVSDGQTFCSLLDGFTLRGTKYQAMNLGVDAYGSLGSAKRLADMAKKLTDIKEVLFFISPNDFAIPEVLRNQGILPDDELDAIHENNLKWKRNFKIQFEATRISYFLQALKLAYEQTQVIWAQNTITMKSEMNFIFSSPVEYTLNTFYKTPTKTQCNLMPVAELSICPEPIPTDQFTCLDQKVIIHSLPPLTTTTIAAYQRMIALSKKYRFKLRPVIIPVQVEEIYCYGHGKSHPLGNYALQAEKYWKSEGMEVIDLSPYTKKMCGEDVVINGKKSKSKIRDYFIPGDGHLTILGNQWLADALKTELEKRIR